VVSVVVKTLLFYLHYLHHRPRRLAGTSTILYSCGGVKSVFTKLILEVFFLVFRGNSLSSCSTFGRHRRRPSGLGALSLWCSSTIPRCTAPDCAFSLCFCRALFRTTSRKFPASQSLRALVGGARRGLWRAAPGGSLSGVGSRCSPPQKTTGTIRGSAT